MEVSGVAEGAAEVADDGAETFDAAGGVGVGPEDVDGGIDGEPVGVQGEGGGQCAGLAAPSGAGGGAVTRKGPRMPRRAI